MKPATLSEFQFISYRVKSFEFHINDEVSDIDSPEWEYSVNLRRTVHEPIPSRTKDSHNAKVVRTPVELAVTVNWEPAPGPFTATITVQGVFEFNSDLPSEDTSRLCRYHAPALLYSQIRPLVRMHASEAGFPNFTLPLLNVAKSLKDHDQDRELAEKKSTDE